MWGCGLLHRGARRTPVSPSENWTSWVVCGYTHTHTHHNINSKKRVIKVGKYKMNDLPWAQGFLSIISKHALHPISESKALRCKTNNKTASMLKKLSLGREADLSTNGCYICRVRSGSTGWGQGESLPALRLGATPQAVGVLALLCRRIMEINWALSTLVQNVT